MALSITQIAALLNRHAKAEDHVVFINGERKGVCKRASFRVVLSLKGAEFPVDYSYVLDGETTTFSSRLRSGGLGVDGREQILVNGQDVDEDDVLIGSESLNGEPALHVEFRYKQSEESHSVRFVAPLSKFN